MTNPFDAWDAQPELRRQRKIERRLDQIASEASDRDPLRDAVIARAAAPWTPPSEVEAAPVKRAAARKSSNARGRR